MHLIERHIQSYCHHNGQIAVLVEFQFQYSTLLRCKEFVVLTKDIAMHIAAQAPVSLDELYNQSFVKEPETSIEGLINRAEKKLGEKIRVSRFIRWSTEVEKPNKNPVPPKTPAVAMRVKK